MRLRISDSDVIEFGDSPKIMGILNVTPDSFSDGDKYLAPDSALRHVGEMLEAGADIIDIGGESTRPGHVPVSADEELRRVVPVIKALSKEYPQAIMSIDTSKAEVASAALQEGVRIVNDVTALEYGGMAMVKAISAFKAGCILMHPRGVGQGDCTEDVKEYLAERIRFAVEATGLDEEYFAVDPGIGFGKTLEQNMELTISSNRLHSLGRPVLIGVSRKSFIGALTGRKVEERGIGTAAAVCLSVYMGADILRVHDVAAARDVVAVACGIMRAEAAHTKVEGGKVAGK